MGQGLRADFCNPDDLFAGRRTCFSYTPEDVLDPPLRYMAALSLQKLGDCCRRLLGSHGVNVQTSVCADLLYTPHWDGPRNVECLAPHLCGMEVAPWLPESFYRLGFRLHDLLPAAAQLQRVSSNWDLG